MPAARLRLLVFLLISHISATAISLADDRGDPIDALVTRLNASNGLWINGVYPVIRLPADAKPQEILSQAIKLWGFDQGHIKTYTIRTIRQVQIAGQMETYSAVLLDSDLGTKILLCKPEKNGRWWTRFYDVPKEKPNASANKDPQQPGTADGISFELLDGTKITGKVNVEQLAVETATGTVKAPIADLVSFIPGLVSRPDLAKRVDTLIAALGSDNFAEREGAQRELTEMGPMLKLIVAEYASDTDAERQNRVGQILKAYETWGARHPEAPCSTTVPMSRLDQIQTTSAKYVGRIAQKQFSLETAYGKFKFEISQVGQAKKARIVPDNEAEKGTFLVGLELRDGSYIRGQLEPSDIKVQGPYGQARIPIPMLREVTVKEDGKSIDAILTGGDYLKGSADWSNKLALKTATGTRAIAPNEILRIAGGGAAIMPSNGLVLHFSLDEKSEQVKDLSGKGNHGTVYEAQFTRQGRFGGAYALDGENDRIEIPNSETLEIRKELTLAVWIKLASFGPGGYANEHGYIINKGVDMWWNPAFCLGYNKGSGANAPRWPAKPGPFTAVIHVCNETGGQSGKTVTSKTALESGKWYHLAGTYDGSKLKVYVNGKLEAEEAYAGLLRSDHAPVHLGGGNLSGTDWGNHFTANGTIDEVAIWNRALSSEEILRMVSEKADHPESDPDRR